MSRPVLKLSVVLFAWSSLWGTTNAADDLRTVISRSDLHYPVPVERSEDGLPLGNGRMGSLVWTTASALRFQINRNDVQPINRDTTSFFERNSDYMGGCAFLDIDLGQSGGAVFAGENAPQHLSVFDGMLSIRGKDVRTRLVAWPHADVFALEVEDQRARPEAFTVRLRMLRHLSQYSPQLEALVKEHIVLVRTRNHTAASQLHVRGDRIVLTQEFKEGTHVAKSAVAAMLIGRPGRPSFAHETEVILTAPAAAGKATILVASAATLDAQEDVAAAALRALDAAAARRFDTLANETAQWWHDYWQRGSIALHSADGTANYISENYHYFLYLMAATSRGKFPTKFNGMLWNTAGDLRTWGSQHWFANLSCLYEALYASNRLELLDPVFDLYSGMYEASAVAARQQWGSEGIFIPETVWFDGLARLPDDVAAEMRDLYLLRKPWDQRSGKFLEFARTKLPHSSRWNWWGGGSWVEGQWVPTERGFGPYGPVTHILGTTAKVAYLYWRRYEYTLDRDWLRTRAYPMLKGAAEFYRHFPNLKKGEDGKLHLHHVNSNESVQGARDTDEDLSAMRGIFAVAARAAEILDVDPELRRTWRETLADLAPLPTSTDPDALKPADYTGPQVIVRGRTPVINGRGFTPDGNSLPHLFFDLCNLDSPDKNLLAIANATFDRGLRAGPPGAATSVGVLSKMAIAGTTLGRVDATRFMIANQMKSLTAEREGAYNGGRPLRNRLSLREGHQAFDAQRLGRAAEALQIALLNSTPPGPGEELTIRVFAAWPPEWDATFTLRARGGFVITAAHQNGKVEFVEIRSEAGATLRLHNPWGATSFVAVRGDGTRENIQGKTWSTATRVGERIRVIP
jgi:hypothetical protein